MDPQDQEATMNLEDFNYNILKMPSTKYLLKDLIKWLQMINEKINFFSFHLT